MIAHDGFLVATTLIAGVIAGVLFAVQIAQIPVQRTLGARDFVLVKRGFELRYGPRMRVLVAVSLVVPIPLYATGGTTTSLALIAIGHAANIAVLVVTAIWNLPVNREVVTWSPDAPPADWEAMRDRWHRGNAIRLPISMLAFAAYVAAAVIE